MPRMKLKETETWLVDTENEAIDMIEDCRAKQVSGGYLSVDSRYKAKIKKAKGEIVDIRYEVTLARSFE